ncbi:MAG: glycosyltransferase family 4 protein [Methanosarcinales archaeon Met12]|nr:MAG: glycosyltransferase family 4 protein [Methanosarcinales archaeon Met12]
MKIAQVCPRYHPDIGGVETHVKAISERLVKYGLDIEVICTNPFRKSVYGKTPHREETINEVKVTRFRSIAPNDAFFFAPGIYNYLKNRDYYVIHAHSYHAFPALFAAFAKKGRKLVFTPYYHGAGHSFIRNILLKSYRPLGARIFKKADKVVCVSQFELNLIKKHFNVPASKLIHIPNGINLDEFRDVKPLERKHKTILFVGRLEKYKGVQHIIQALPLLEEYRLEIVGTGLYGQELKKLASKLGVSERIDWIKELSRAELLRHYKSADVFVMPSQFEAYGITVAEALASGVPCIVATGSALEEFVDDETCIGMSHPIESALLASTIESVCSRRANKVKNLMDWDEVVNKLTKIYDEK